MREQVRAPPKPLTITELQETSVPPPSSSNRYPHSPHLILSLRRLTPTPSGIYPSLSPAQLYWRSLRSLELGTLYTLLSPYTTIHSYTPMYSFSSLYTPLYTTMCILSYILFIHVQLRFAWQ